MLIRPVRDAQAMPSDAPHRAPAVATDRPRRRWSLVWRLLATNGAVLAVAMSILSLTPATLPAPGSLEDIIVLVGALTVLLVTNLFLLRRALSPLRQLTDLMHRVDPLRPGERIPEYGPEAEVVELTKAFNAMLVRLESERREATRLAVAAQEGERRRIAQELHDEIGQGLTAALLQIEGAAYDAPESLRGRLSEASETVRTSLEDARGVASRLRPEALDDLGLESAITALATRLTRQAGLTIDVDLAEGLPRLPPEDEIVVYRVTQEALTNVLRHSQASHAWVCLGRREDSLCLTVSDNGVGLDDGPPGGGILGMRERALLIGADLRIRSREGGGAEVLLEIPVGRAT